MYKLSVIYILRLSVTCVALWSYDGTSYSGKASD